MKKKDILKKRCDEFWDALFGLLIDDGRNIFKGNYYWRDINDRFEMCLNDEFVIVKKKNGASRMSKAKRHPESNVYWPYYTLLSWYLREFDL